MKQGFYKVEKLYMASDDSAIWFSLGSAMKKEEKTLRDASIKRVKLAFWQLCIPTAAPNVGSPHSVIWPK